MKIWKRWITHSLTHSLTTWNQEMQEHLKILITHNFCNPVSQIHIRDTFEYFVSGNCSQLVLQRLQGSSRELDQDQRLLWHTEPTYCRGQDWLRYRGRKFGQRPGRLSLTLAWHFLLQSLRDPWTYPRPSWEPHQSDARQNDWDKCQINQISNICKCLQILIIMAANIDTS